MPNRTDQSPGQPTPLPVALQAATVEACAADLRTPAQQTAAAGAARNQLANTRMSAAANAETKAAGRQR